MTRRITCKDTTWLVSESRERALSEEELRSLNAHIADCSYCQGASRQFDVLFKEIRNYFGTAVTGKHEER